MGKGLGLSIVVCAAFIVGGASATFAGEVTGTGKSLQIAPHTLHGKSACAFSGLEDNPFSPGTVQSYGKHPNDARGPGGVSDDPENNNPGNGGSPPLSPSKGCNPTWDPN